jgi:hypothetical protein
MQIKNKYPNEPIAPIPYNMHYWTFVDFDDLPHALMQAYTTEFFALFFEAFFVF